MKNKLFQYIRKAFFTQKVITFLICVLIASFLWLFNSLNRNYNLTIDVPIQFSNIPKGKYLSSPLPKKINIEIKTSGVKYLFLQFKNNLEPISVDLSNFFSARKGKEQFSLSTSSTIGNLSKLLNTEIEIVKISPDSLYFNFGKTYKKVLPVKAKLFINFDPLTNYQDKIKINPAFVTLYGDSMILNTIDSISTEKIVLNKLNQNIKQSLKLVLPSNLENRASLSVENVLVEVEIDKLTESNVVVPVKVVNVPENMIVKTFPDQVKIKYQVGMNDFEKIDANLFLLTADFRNHKEGNPQLKIELQKAPENIKILQLSHQKVEFIARNKK